MPICETCGNDYDKAFEIMHNGERHVFDSFECAIEALAPRCAHCGCRIIGHGMESSSASGSDKMFCCAHCAEQAGVAEMKERI
jgi:hypothetical protein